MEERHLVSDGLKQVFSHRSAFFVIGLTGRTGSGCTTAADLLSSPRFDDIELPEIPNPPKSQEDRKDRIVREWLKDNWIPFKKIQVSQVILLLAISDADRFIDILLSLDPDVDVGSVRRIIEPVESVCQKCISVLSNIRECTDADACTCYDFLFDGLSQLSESIKSELNKNEKKYYTPVFQILGDNVRKSGSPLSSEIEPSRLLSLPETISRIIKLARLRNKIKNETDNYYVIDALRHPFEIRYLRERISPFYAMAITTDDFDRKIRLTQLNFSIADITRLDEKEYPSEIKDKKRRPTGYAAFVTQNIQACLEISDTYISNLGRPEVKETRAMASQVIRYVALMQRPGMITPTSMERCMHAALSAKINSGCISRQVGAVITDSNYSIKAVGWNDVPKGQVPCLLRNTYFAVTKRMDGKAYSKYEQTEDFVKELKKSSLGRIQKSYLNGRNITYCFKTTYNTIKGDNNQVHTRALHAEENAFLQIVKYGGQGIEGGFLFTTASPCELCAKKAYQLGIRRIFFIDPYPGISNDHILSVGEQPPEVILFSGAIGRAYHNLYEPIMPYKDELEKLLSDA